MVSCSNCGNSNKKQMFPLLIEPNLLGLWKQQIKCKKCGNIFSVSFMV